MADKNVITEYIEVLGGDGVHVGNVDAVQGDRIKLTRSGSGDGAHHYVPTSLVQDIKGNSVTLTATGAEALAPGQA